MIDQVCNAASLYVEEKLIVGTERAEEAALRVVLRTPPSTIRSTPFNSVLVKPVVTLAVCWLP